MRALLFSLLAFLAVASPVVSAPVFSSLSEIEVPGSVVEADAVIALYADADILADFEFLRVQGISAVALRQATFSDEERVAQIAALAFEAGLQCVLIVEPSALKRTIVKKPLSDVLHSSKASGRLSFLLEGSALMSSRELAEAVAFVREAYASAAVGLSLDAVMLSSGNYVLLLDGVDFFTLRLNPLAGGRITAENAREALPRVYVDARGALEQLSHLGTLTPCFVQLLSYPRDSGFRLSSSSTNARNALLSFLREAAPRGAGLMLGGWIGREPSEGQPESSAVYASDTLTLQLLAPRD